MSSSIRRATALRIVKKSEFGSMPYRVGRSASEQGGVLLRTLANRQANIDLESAITTLEEKIIRAGITRAEEIAAEVLAGEKKRLADSMRAEISRAIGAAEEKIVGVVMEITEKICRKTVEDDSGMVKSWVKAAVEKLSNEAVGTIRINPKDREAVESIKTELLASREYLRDLIIRLDEEIERGGCIVSGEHQVIDATLSARFAEAGRALRLQ